MNEKIKELIKITNIKDEKLENSINIINELNKKCEKLLETIEIKNKLISELKNDINIIENENLKILLKNNEWKNQNKIVNKFSSKNIYKDEELNESNYSTKIKKLKNKLNDVKNQNNNKIEILIENYEKKNNKLKNELNIIKEANINITHQLKIKNKKINELKSENSSKDNQNNFNENILKNIKDFNDLIDLNKDNNINNIKLENEWVYKDIIFLLLQKFENFKDLLVYENDKFEETEKEFNGFKEIIIKQYKNFYSNFILQNNYLKEYDKIIEKLIEKLNKYKIKSNVNQYYMDSYFFYKNKYLKKKLDLINFKEKLSLNQLNNKDFKLF